MYYYHNWLFAIVRLNYVLLPQLVICHLEAELCTITTTGYKLNPKLQIKREKKLVTSKLSHI